MANNKKNKSKRKLAPPEAAALLTIVEPASYIAEQYRTIRTNILYSGLYERTKSIIIASSGPHEGKSTTASNLAVVFAQSGIKTILIDADLRRPTIHKTFNIVNENGLTNLLSVRSLSISDVVQVTNINNLDIITCGVTAPNPSELLASNRMKKLVNILKKEYEFIIFDVPPLNYVTDAQLVASQVDGVLLAIEENKTKKESLKKAITMLKQVDATLLGAIYRENSSDNNTYEYDYY